MGEQNLKKRAAIFILTGTMMAGFLVLLIGAYYCVVKAGIPYQDPPLDLQIQYAVNMGIGKVLVKDGFMILLWSGIARLALWLVFKYHTAKDQAENSMRN